MITLYDTYRSTHGLNYHPGGTGDGFNTFHAKRRRDPALDTAWRKKISVSVTLTMTPEHRELLRQRSTGHEADAASRAKISTALKGKPRSVIARAALKAACTPEVLARRSAGISQAKRGVLFTATHKAALKQAQTLNRWQCSDCPYTSTGRWVEEHLKKTGHSSKERVRV